MRLKRYCSRFNSSWFSAISDGVTVGSFEMRRTSRKYWELWSVQIEERFQGVGFGKKMMALAVKLARRLKAPGLWLNCYSNNAPAKAIYRRAGFTLKSTGFSMTEGSLAFKAS